MAVSIPPELWRAAEAAAEKLRASLGPTARVSPSRDEDDDPQLSVVWEAKNDFGSVLSHAVHVLTSGPETLLVWINTWHGPAEDHGWTTEEGRRHLYGKRLSVLGPDKLKGGAEAVLLKAMVKASGRALSEDHLPQMADWETGRARWEPSLDAGVDVARRIFPRAAVGRSGPPLPELRVSWETGDISRTVTAFVGLTAQGCVWRFLAAASRNGPGSIDYATDSCGELVVYPAPSGGLEAAISKALSRAEARARAFKDKDLTPGNPKEPPPWL